MLRMTKFNKFDKLTQANQNLNGNKRVAEAKTDASNTIDHLKYLNEPTTNCQR